MNACLCGWCVLQLLRVCDELQAARTLSISSRTAFATGHSQKQWSVALTRVCKERD